MITDKLVNALLQSALSSIALLERLEAKVDAQAVGKLRGAFRSLQTASEQREGAATVIQMALGSFTESAEYFRALIESIGHELNVDRRLEKQSAVGKVFGWGKLALGSVRDLVGVGGGELNKQLWLEIQRTDCVNLLILSEIGRIACMTELNYDESVIARELDQLTGADFEVDPDPYLDRVVALGQLPAQVARMDRQAFLRSYGAVVDYRDTQPGDERREMKEFIVENYGSSVDEIKRNNPGYGSICRRAGREPENLDDYVAMVMTHAAEDEDLEDKVLDWAETKILYWADRDMLSTWAGVFFRYAALRTLLATNREPQKLLTRVASGGLAD